MKALMADIELKNRRWKQSVVVVVAVFMAAMTYLVVANYQNGVKLNNQVKDLKTIQDNQAKQVGQLNDSVDTLKADNEKNLKIIICMLQVPIAQRTTDTENSCRKQVATLGSAPTNSAPKPQPTAISPLMQSNTQDNPPTSITRSINSFLSKTLKKIGL